MRSVQDRFWSDGWVRKLNPLDRYLFLYILTNEHTNWCGIYELDIGMMAFESGIDREELQRSMLPRLAPKAVYVDGWVYIPNWLRHHGSESGSISPTQQKGIEAAWKGVPERIRLKIKEIEEKGIPYAYPMVGVSPSASALSSAYPILDGDKSPFKITEVSEDEGGAKRSTYEERMGYPTSRVKPLRAWAEQRMGKKFTAPTKQERFIADMFKAGYAEEQIQNQWQELELDEFWGRKGFDFARVADEIGKAKGAKPVIKSYGTK